MHTTSRSRAPTNVSKTQDGHLRGWRRAHVTVRQSEQAPSAISQAPRIAAGDGKRAWKASSLAVLLRRPRFELRANVLPSSVMLSRVSSRASKFAESSLGCDGGVVSVAASGSAGMKSWGGRFRLRPPRCGDTSDPVDAGLSASSCVGRVKVLSGGVLRSCQP